MSDLRVYNLGGLNLKTSPFLHKEGEMIRCVNVENDMSGAKKKRPGYNTYLTSLGTEITSLFNWTKDDGVTFWNYAVAGGTLHYSQQGTGDWTVCGNGTLTNNARPGYAVLENTMVLGDGTTLTRHTTDGTSFTDTSAAPYANYFSEYQNRIYAGGTASSLFYSTTGTPTNWTSDSSSLSIPGAGRINGVFKSQDRLIISKNAGNMFRWDGYSLADLVTNLAPTTPYLSGVEDYKFLLNRQGAFAFSGLSPEIISNPVERQIYNDKGNGIAGTVFDNAPNIAHRYDWLASVGTVTDNLTDETINRLILKYDYQADEWSNWQFADKPTAFGIYQDVNGDKQLIFGDTTGQCYTFGGTNTSDNGQPISAVMQGILHLGAPELDKDFRYIWAVGNPGCGAQVQVAITDTVTKTNLSWIPLGDFHDGIAERPFPANSRGKLLSWKVTESSKDARFHFYGFTVNFDYVSIR